MIGPFAVINEDFQRYLINFHIAREAFRRGEPPSEDVMDILYEGKSANLPETAYREEREHSEANLEKLIQLAVSEFATNRFPKKVLTSDGEVEAYSYELDRKSNMLYVLKRVKSMDTYGIKSIGTVTRQGETGFFDQKGMRIIVESHEARNYRTHRKFRNLSPEEKKRFKELFHGKKEHELSDTQKTQFYRAFGVEYRELTEKEKEEYTSKFAAPNIEIGRSLAERIVSLKCLDSIPISQHYMLLHGLELRVQRQIVVDNKGNKIMDFEYLLGRDRDQFGNLFRSVLGSCGYERDVNNAEPVTEYTDLKNRKALLVNLDGLLVNFHMHGGDLTGVQGISLITLAEKIKERYEEAQRRFSKGSQDEKLSPKEKEQKKAKRESEVLAYVKLKMSDLPGCFIYSETTTVDLKNRYLDIEFDPSKTFQTFIDDITGENRHSNGYQTIKLYLCFNPQSKQISGEVQIRDPIMDYDANFGKARKGERGEYERKKAARYVEGGTETTEKDMEFYRAFFLNDEPSNSYFFRILADYYSKSILRIADEIARIEGIPRERDRFDVLFTRIEGLFTKAKERIKSPDLENVVSAVNSVFTNYVQSKGVGILTYYDSLWEISKRLGQVSETSKVRLGYFSSPKELGEFLHTEHIGMLWDIFVKLAQSGNIAHVASSFAVGRLIRHYNECYGMDSLPHETQKEYRKRMDRFYEDSGWRPYKVSGSTIGYAPLKFLHGKRMKIAVQDGALDTSEASPLSNADIGTIEKITASYRLIRNMWPKSHK